MKNEHSQAIFCALVNDELWVDVIALPDFNFLMAASSYSTVKSDDRLASAVAALESEVTSRDVQRANSLSLSAYGKRPLFRSCAAMSFAVIGHVDCVVLLHVSLFMIIVVIAITTITFGFVQGQSYCNICISNVLRNCSIFPTKEH